MSGESDPFGDRLTRRLAQEPQGRLLAPGEVVANRYEVEERLGEGGSGAVYKVKDRQTGRSVALKIVLPERIARPGALEALAAEAAIARDIRHPNVVGVYDVRTETDPPFITMEYVAGRSLWEWMKDYRRERKPWPMATAAAIVRAVLDGLEAAHEAGVIHRDIKPENIILTAEPTAARAALKIIDFGIAQAGPARTGGVSSEGTAIYMAPEGLYSRDELTSVADLYSLSVVFYELLVGAPPRHWRPPSQGRADTPAGIDALIEAGLSPNVLVRPQSAAAYRQLLIDALAPTKTEPAARSAPAPQAVADADEEEEGEWVFLDEARPAPAPVPPPKPAPAPQPDVPALLRQAQTLMDKASGLTRGKGDWSTPWDQAHQLLKQASATGDVAAKIAYGRFLERGLGGYWPAKPEIARQWYESAVKQGSGEAMAALGDMDRFGRGGPKNAAQSIAWYVKAGEAGFAQGDYLAGFAYRAKLPDWGGQTDLPKARRHLERAAQGGVSAAMLHLGEMLAEGQGGPPDRAAAKQWLERALKAGHDSAADRLKEYKLR